jgi:hypothetical protein
MTIIVVEGVDGAGKSTLIANLRAVSDRYFWILRASGPPSSAQEVELAIDKIDELGNGAPSLNWVFDRHPLISEPIYGRVLRGKSHLDGMASKVYRERIASINKIIYCRPPFKTVLDGVQIENQLAGVHERIRELYDAYDEAIDFMRIHLRVPIITYDWTAADLTRQYKGESCDLNDLFWVRGF